jgi:hypothetical protein
MDISTAVNTTSVKMLTDSIVVQKANCHIIVNFLSLFPTAGSSCLILAFAIYIFPGIWSLTQECSSKEEHTRDVSLSPATKVSGVLQSPY